MSLESVSFPNDLDTANPVSGDLRSEGDDHLRNLKTAIKAAFPGLAGRAWRKQTKSINYTVLATDNMTLFNIATTGITLSFTAAATLGNGHLCFVYANGFNVTLDPDSAELINGAATLVITSGNMATVFCDGTGFVAAQFPLVAFVETLPVTIIDAKGDLIGGTAADTAGRLAVGANNKVLIADSTQSTGMRWDYQPVWLCFAVTTEADIVTTGTAKFTFRLPACTVLAARLSAKTASSSGLPAVDVNDDGVSIFSPVLTMDENEKTSVTATTPAVIANPTVADDSEMTVDVDTAGTGTAGLKLYLQVKYTG